jgi:hypothetical protein
MSCVVRDVEHHPLVQEVQKLRVMPIVKSWHEVLGDRLNAKQRAMLRLALSFHTWRSLVRDSGFTQGAAVDAMVEAIEGAK